jgi:4-diphosphocytidyl-2-C-methyl-D-erythritol kinase
MITFPNAKINLGLHVTRRRSDGFHDLETLFFPVRVTDALEIIPSDTFNFHSSGIAMDADPERNLVVRAYRLLEKDFGLPSVKMHLHKVIPTGAGLGGGSSDAAFALRMLNRIFSLGLSLEQLLDYAGCLGSDCPFFILDQPALAKGRGDILTTFRLDLSGLRIVIVKPPGSVNTAQAYKGIVAREPEIPLSEIISQPPETWKNCLSNDFEDFVFSLYPEIAGIKAKLYDLGAVYASMSGSGSAVFGLFIQNPGNIRLQFQESYTVFTEDC